MVIAGIRKRNNHGANVNNPSRLAYPPHKTLFSPGISHRKEAVRIKYTAITIGPVNEEKNDLNSFSKTASIDLILLISNLIANERQI